MRYRADNDDYKWRCEGCRKLKGDLKRVIIHDPDSRFPSTLNLCLDCRELAKRHHCEIVEEE